ASSSDAVTTGVKLSELATSAGAFATVAEATMRICSDIRSLRSCGSMLPPNRSASECADMAKRTFDQLVQLMTTLRGPQGCPWDHEQTLATLKPFVIEEAYEVLDAIDRHDRPALAEELG